MSDFLIALDPGKMSGLSLIDLRSANNPVLVWSGEFEQYDTCHKIDQLLSDHSAGTFEVACEAFIVTPETAKKSPAAWSSEIIGTVRYFCTRDSTAFTLQTPTAAKSFCDNDRLRALGFWHRGGAGHANDSLRHAVLYLVEKKNWRPEALLV